MAKVKPHTFFKKKNQPEHEKKPRELPSIYLKFTEKIFALFQSRKWIGIILLFFSLLLLTLFAGKQAYQHYQKKEAVIAQRDAILAKITYWQKVVAEHNGYRDGYFQLAILSYELGRITDAKGYLVQAMQIDPNFVDGKKLESVIFSLP